MAEISAAVTALLEIFGSFSGPPHPPKRANIVSIITVDKTKRKVPFAPKPNKKGQGLVLRKIKVPTKQHDLLTI